MNNVIFLPPSGFSANRIDAVLGPILARRRSSFNADDCIRVQLIDGLGIFTFFNQSY
jgi:RPA family protein